jgi:hypothetical protein
MKQRLTELTGVGARSSTPDTHVPVQRASARLHGAQGNKPSLVRTAITLLLQQPSVALALPSALHFASLEQPGVDLLVEMIELVQQRPDISTGLVLSGRPSSMPCRASKHRRSSNASMACRSACLRWWKPSGRSCASC